MKVAVIGSRKLKIDLSFYIPKNATEIITGGAYGIDKIAEVYADTHQIKKTVLKPEYELYGKGAPLKRNDLIIEYADYIIAIWDGRSRGTKYVIDHSVAQGKPVKVIKIEKKEMPFEEN